MAKDDKKKEIEIIPREVSISGNVKVKWEELNPDIGEYEPTQRDFKERPSDSFFDSAKDVVEQAAQALGYPSKHEAWGAYKAKKIKLEGLKVTVEFIHFTRKCSSPIETKLPQTNDVTGPVIEDFIAEIREFIKGKNRKQGDLFNNNIHDADIEIQDAVIVDDDDESEAGNNPELSESNVGEEGLVKA